MINRLPLEITKIENTTEYSDKAVRLFIEAYYSQFLSICNNYISR